MLKRRSIDLAVQILKSANYVQWQLTPIRTNRTADAGLFWKNVLNHYIIFSYFSLYYHDEHNTDTICFRVTSNWIFRNRLIVWSPGTLVTPCKQDVWKLFLLCGYIPASNPILAALTIFVVAKGKDNQNLYFWHKSKTIIEADLGFEAEAGIVSTHPARKLWLKRKIDTIFVTVTSETASEEFSCTSRNKFPNVLLVSYS